jgi:hypothetical protein
MMISYIGMVAQDFKRKSMMIRIKRDLELIEKIYKEIARKRVTKMKEVQMIGTSKGGTVGEEDHLVKIVVLMDIRGAEAGAMML